MALSLTFNYMPTLLVQKQFDFGYLNQQFFDKWLQPRYCIYCLLQVHLNELSRLYHAIVVLIPKDKKSKNDLYNSLESCST